MHHGSIPQAMPGDKARTSAILIPPDCDPATMGQIAERVVTLSDLRGIALNVKARPTRSGFFRVWAIFS